MWFFHCSCRSTARLVGKTVVITGANTGIGKEAARDFYRRGARVILACRDLNKAQEAVEDIKKNAPSSKGKQFDGEPGELKICHLDLSSLKSVKECAKNLLSTEPAIHILVNNAGVMMCSYTKTEDGYENQLQVNYIGHFLLTLLLLPKLQQSAPGCKIINVSSTAHHYGQINFDDLQSEKSYSPWKAYAQSKLGNVLFTKELTRQLEDANITGINTYALHPGMVTTEISRHMNQTIFPGVTLLTKPMRLFLKNSEQGAQTTIYCAVDEKAEVETGLYYKDCGAAEPSEISKNPETAKRLWNSTCDLLGLQQKDNFKELLKEVSQKFFNKN